MKTLMSSFIVDAILLWIPAMAETQSLYAPYVEAVLIYHHVRMCSFVLNYSHHEKESIHFDPFNLRCSYCQGNKFFQRYV